MGRADKTYAAVFADPVRANIAWQDIEAMLVSRGAAVSEGAGSRVRFVLNGVVGLFHRPHPQKEAGRGVVVSVRRFLTDAEAAGAARKATP